MNIRHIVSVVIVAVVLESGLFAQGRPELIKGIDTITTQDQLSEWLTYYYLHPRPDLVVSAVQFMSKHGQFSEAEAQSPVCVFLAQVFAANAGKVESWFGQLNGGTEDQKSSLALVLWMVGSSGSDARLRSLGQVGSGGFQNYVRGLLADDHRPDFLHDAIKNAGFLDDLWASFFASGDERYVKRIIGALQLANVHGDTGKLLIGGAAKWSLTSNAFQHPKVMQICEAELNQLPEDQRITLTQVIQSAREHKP